MWPRLRCPPFWVWWALTLALGALLLLPGHARAQAFGGVFPGGGSGGSSSATPDPTRADTAASYTATGPNGVRVVPQVDLGALGACAALAGAYASAHVEGEDDPSPTFCDGIDWTRVWTERDGSLLTAMTVANLEGARLSADSSTYALRVTNNGKVDFGTSTNDECQSSGGRVVCKSWTFTDIVVDNFGNNGAQPISFFSIYGIRLFPYGTLETCSAGRSGSLAALSTDNRLHYCDGTTWIRVGNSSEVPVTHDFPNVPAASCVDSAVGVTGAAAGRSIQASADFDLPAGVGIGNVRGTGADAVSLRLCNVSAVDQNPSSGSFRFVIFR